MRGYGSALILCSFVVGALGGLMLSGAASREPEDVYLQSAASGEEVRRINNADSWRGFSVGLLILLTAIFTGLAGYLLTEVGP